MTKQPNPFDLQIPQDDRQNDSSSSGILLECDREYGRQFQNHRIPMGATIFSSNKTLQLCRFNLSVDVPRCEYTVEEGTEPTSFEKFIFEENLRKTEIVLPEPIDIKSGKFYRISYRDPKTNRYRIKGRSKKDQVQLDNGINIKFVSYTKDAVKKLYFMLPEQ